MWNIEAAQAGAGFKFQLPFLLQCFAQPQISYIKNSLIQVLYVDPHEKHLLVRKGHGTDDNSGDYTDYPIVKKISVNKMTVTLKGSSEGYFNASWNTGAFAYAILSTEALPEDELVKLIQMLQ